MSHWVNINKIIVIRADMGLLDGRLDDWKYPLYQSDIDKEVADIIANAPKLTGSEGPADVFVNRGSWEMCAADKFGSAYDTESDDWKNGVPQCKTDDGDEIRMIGFKTEYIVTVCGALRDRMPNETRREWLAFKRYLYAKFSRFGVTIAK